MNSTPSPLAIIGSGPAGLTAAIYAARAKLNPVLFAGIEFGGQLMGTTVVENYPGFPEGVDGPELMQRMIKQAENFGTEIVYQFVRAVDFKSRPFKLKTDESERLAHAVIVAVGSSPRRLGLDAENKFWGRGISTCATCDAAFFKDKTVAVIGGGDSAMEEASFLTRFAKQVYIIHRGDRFRAGPIMQDRVLNHPQVKILWNTQVTDILGDKTVNALKLVDTQTQSESELAVDGMFLAIGHVPNTGFLKDQVELDPKGYIKVFDRSRTSVEGVFVAGDVEDWVYQQAITAAGDGCKAALEAQKWLEKEAH